MVMSSGGRRISRLFFEAVHFERNDITIICETVTNVPVNEHLFCVIATGTVSFRHALKNSHIQIR
jgi:hypothetical protein